MAQCSGATNTPKNTLRSAKRNGAPGFVGYRIDWTLLEPWLKQNINNLRDDEDENDSLLKYKTKKEKHLANLAEIEESKAREKYVLKDDIQTQIRAVALAQKNILKTVLTQELPSKLLGMNTTEMAVEMDKVVHRICTLMETLEVK